jgi:acyl carrier protein
MERSEASHPGAGDDVGRQVAGLIAETLDLKGPVDLESSLGALGLDSLPAARLWLEVQDRFGVDIPFTWLSGDLTVAEFAERVVGARSGGRVRDRVAVIPDAEDRFTPFPLTPIQQTYVTGTQPELTSDPVGCHQYLEFSVDQVDTGALDSAWRRLVEHHDMLRAVVTPEGTQRVLDQAP